MLPVLRTLTGTYFRTIALLAGHLRRLFAFIRTIQNFTGPLFRNFVIQFIIKTFPRQLFKALLRLSYQIIKNFPRQLFRTLFRLSLLRELFHWTLAPIATQRNLVSTWLRFTGAFLLRVFLITEDYGYPYLPSLLFPGGGLILVLIMTILSLIISSLAGQLAMITNNSVSQSVNHAITLAPPTFPVI